MTQQTKRPLVRLFLSLATAILATGALVAGPWLESSAPGAPAGESAALAVIWRPPGDPAGAVRATVVPRGEWLAFVDSRRQQRAQTRAAIVAAARDEMVQALAPAFDQMRARIPDYLSWFYSFPTTYRMTFSVMVAVFGTDKSDPRPTTQVAGDAIDRMLQDRFLDVVVLPARFGDAVGAAATEVFQHAAAAELQAAQVEQQALVQFMAGYGQSPARPGADGLPLVLAWEALGFAPDPAAIAAPPDAGQLVKSDPSLQGLQSSLAVESGLMVTRQVVRRVISSNADDVILGLVGTAIGPAALAGAETVITPIAGFVAFGLGLGAELGAVKTRQLIDGAQLEASCQAVVEDLRQSQARQMADAVAQRLERWLPERNPALKTAAR